MDPLFLGVFNVVSCCVLWFLAEYQLEHKIEKDREKQFIRSFAYDIKADTARLNYLIKARIMRDIRLDSLSILMNSPSPGEHTNYIYFYAVTATRLLPVRFLPNDGTLQQLKNSGAFRLIRSREVADSIGKYDVSVRNFIQQQELEDVLAHDYRSAAAKMFDALFFEPMLDENNNPTRLIAGNPALSPYEKTDLREWNYKLYSMKALNKANRRDARLLLTQAENLLATLNKKYRLN